ncbi:T9SS type A sorting domain-containing protein [bacterium]|nr:T9SS type A sorting domain-containing protein [bacterium]
MHIKAFFAIITIGLVSSYSFGRAAVDLLKAETNQADYLMITRCFNENDLAVLIDHRESQGLKVELIFMDQITNEFIEAGEEPEQIRSFVTYALEHWRAPKPRYLLLVGDSDIIPSYCFYHFEELAAADEWYGISESNTDGPPDIAIGRFPVSNGDELSILIHKTISFEYMDPHEYGYHYLFVADHTDNQTGVFERRTEEFVNEIIFSEASYLRLDLNPDSEYAGELSDFQAMVAQSPEFVIYLGHGNDHTWSDSLFLTTEKVVDVIQNQIPYIMTTYACGQTFLGKGPQSIVENMLILPGGGAVATFAPTAEHFESVGAQMLKTFHQTVLSNNDFTIGEVIQSSKNEMRHYQTTIKLFTLLGDPAMKLPSLLRADAGSQDIANPVEFCVKPNYPNPFNTATTLAFILPYAGEVRIRIYSVAGQAVLDTRGFYPYAGQNTFQWCPADLSSGVYIARLSFGSEVQVQRMHLLK